MLSQRLLFSSSAVLSSQKPIRSQQKTKCRGSRCCCRAEWLRKEISSRSPPWPAQHKPDRSTFKSFDRKLDPPAFMCWSIRWPSRPRCWDNVKLLVEVFVFFIIELYLVCACVVGQYNIYFLAQNPKANGAGRLGQPWETSKQFNHGIPIFLNTGISFISNATNFLISQILMKTVKKIVRANEKNSPC